MSPNEHTEVASGERTQEFHHVDMWHSAAGAPMWPSGREVGAFLAHLGKGDVRACTAVRAKLERPIGKNLRRTRRWLELKQSVIASTLDREFGPEKPAEFDVLIDPGRELAAVGNEFVDMVTIAEATVVALEVGDEPIPADSLAEQSTRQAISFADRSQTDVEEAFAELRSEIDPIPYEELAGELDLVVDTEDGTDDIEALLGPAVERSVAEPADESDSSVKSAAEVSAVFAASNSRQEDPSTADAVDTDGESGTADDDRERAGSIDEWLTSSRPD